MSPLTSTGTETASTTGRTAAQSACPLKNWQRVRPCTVMSLHPSATARRARSGAFPSRCLVPAQAHLERHRYLDREEDHGLDERLRMIEIAHESRARQLSRDFARWAAHVDVDGVRRLFCSAILAPSAIRWASRPASWITKGLSSLPSARLTTSLRARTSSSLAIISETTRLAPKRCARRRNGKSETPDMGASATGAGAARTTSIGLFAGVRVMSAAFLSTSWMCLPLVQTRQGSAVSQVQTMRLPDCPGVAGGLPPFLSPRPSLAQGEVRADRLFERAAAPHPSPLPVKGRGEGVLHGD